MNFFSKFFLVAVLLNLSCSSLSRNPSSSETPKIEDRFELAPGAELPLKSYAISKWGRWQISKMSDEEIFQIYQSLAASNLPFRYPKDCCHDRAHKMSYWMDQAGIISVKVFVFGDLKIMDPDTEKEVTWEFHVAPALMNSRSQIVVLDPSVADRPLELSQWLSRFSNPGQRIKVQSASRFYYSPGDLDLEKNEWNEAEMKELVDLSLMGCKAIENRRKSRKSN